MPNSKIVKSKTLWGAFFAALFVGVYLAACGGGGGGGSPAVGGAAVPAPAPAPVTAGAPIAFSAPPADAGGGQVIVNVPNGTAGALIVNAGDPVVITSNITTLDGPNTATTATPTSITVTATLPPTLPPTITGSVSSVGGILPSPGCTTTTTGTAGAITLPKSTVDMDTVPSRFAGVAPLAVFFDATGATATATTRPFHDIEYRWDFGDKDGAGALNKSPPLTGATTWANGSRSGVSKRNEATGPVAAHVFETPGIYIVNLTVTDGTNTTSNSCIQIAVTDPDQVFSDSNTTCVAATSLPVAGAGGCPSGADVRQEPNFTTALGFIAGTKKRLLFKRGDSFTAAGNGNMVVTGPGIIGAYGTGALPKITASVDGITLFQPSTNSTPNSTSNLKDWRIMDLELTGGDGTFTGVDAINPGGGINQVTVLRVYAHHVNSGVRLNAPTLNFHNSTGFPGHTLFDQMVIVDSTTNNITGFSAALSVFASATRFMMLGNSFDNNSGGEHTVRLPYIGKGVVSNNTFQGQPPTKAAFTLRSSVFGSTGVEGGIGTQYVVVSDNKFIDAVGSDFITYYGPQGAVDERVVDVITERNLYLAGGGPVSGTQVGLALVGHEHTIRNNLFNTSGGRAHLAIKILDLTVISDQIRVYNNTMYSADTDIDFIGVRVDPAETNVTVKNNLGYAPNDTQHFMVSCGGSPSFALCPTLTAANNSTNTDVLSTNPNFTATPPVATTDWRPTAGYAIGTNNACGGAPCATSVPVWSDFFRVDQPAARDLGAVVH